MKKLVLAIVFASAYLPGSAYVGQVIDESGGAIFKAKVVLEKDGEVLSVTSTDLDGNLNTIYTPGDCTVKIEAEGYEPCELNPTQGYLGKVTLKRKAMQLQEVAVTASNAKQHFDYTAYTLSKKQMERHATVYAALQEIPQMVFVDGLRYRGSDNIKLLINGVESNPQEYMALAKEDIREIRVYDVPPPRFADENVASVVDIVTKTDMTAASMFLMLDETPQPWCRTSNYVSGNYTYGKNRFGLSYNNNFNRSDLDGLSETIIYRTSTETITKQRESTYEYGRNMEHDFKASYLFSNPFSARPTQFNFDFHGNFTNHMNLSHSDVTVGRGGVTQFTRSSSSNRDRVANLDASAYFHRLLTKKHLILANVVATGYDTRNRQGYGETDTATGLPLFDYSNATDNRLYSVKGEVQHTIYNVGPGRMSTNAKYYWQRTFFDSNSTDSRLDRNDASLSVSYMVWVKKVYLLGKVAANYLNLRNSCGGAVESRFTFTPYLYLYWNAGSKVKLTAVASRQAIAPTASQLTTQTQYVDEGLRRTGNPQLKPFATNMLNVTQSFTSSHFQYSLWVSYNYAPKMIVPEYDVQDDYVLESYANASDVHRADAGITLVYSPLDGLNFSGNFIGGQFYIRSGDERWRIPTWRFNLNASYSTSRWDFSMSYQFPGRDGLGVIKRKRVQALDLYAAFKPNPNLAIGINIGNPFMSLKEARSSVEGKPVYFNETAYLKSMESSVGLRLTWNLSIGKRKIENNRNINDSDSDSGRLNI